MGIFDTEPKVDIILKKFPTYYLVARVLEINKEKFLETHDESLILYKFCVNLRSYKSVDEINEKRKRNLYKR